MSTNILREIRTRAAMLWLASHGKLSRVECEKAAAVELASERRGAKASAAVTMANAAEPNLLSARSILIARVMAVSERLKATPRKRHRLPPEAEVVLPHVLDPLASTPNGVEAAPVEPVVAIGIFVGPGSGAAELIDDGEFHSSVCFGDRATNNWRNSIQANERMAARRRGLWVG
jgi:hypothetical protein